MTSTTINGGVFIGAIGDKNTYIIYGQNETSDEPFDFGVYMNSVAERLRREASTHVQLDIEPKAARFRSDCWSSKLRYLAATGGGEDLRIYIEPSCRRSSASSPALTARCFSARCQAWRTRRRWPPSS